MINIRTTNSRGIRVNIRQLAAENPDRLVGVRTSSVYSQIARTGRCPSKNDERTILVESLNNARKVKINYGKKVTVEPTYVPMKAKDVLKCFGRKTDRLTANSQIKVLETYESL